MGRLGFKTSFTTKESRGMGQGDAGEREGWLACLEGSYDSTFLHVDENHPTEGARRTMQGLEVPGSR